MTAKDGGPAFPGEKNVRFGQVHDVNEGMPLRDYMAVKILAADIAREQCPITQVNSWATFAYAMADAMLAARERGVAA